MTGRLKSGLGKVEFAGMGEEEKKETRESEDDAAAPGPWYAGKVYCTRCHYRWVAVAPVDSALRGGLECPRCGGMNGWLPKEDKDGVVGGGARDGSGEDTDGKLG